MYTADWNSIKLSAAYTYTWMESAALSGSFQAGFCDFPGSTNTDEDSPLFGSSTCFGDQDTLHNDNLHQIGASILHKPSGLGIFGQYTDEETGGTAHNFVGFDSNSSMLDPGLLQHQHAYGDHLVHQALLAEGLGIYERCGARLPWRDHSVWRVWSI